MIAATTKSTVMQNGGHQRVSATNWVRCCQRSLSPWPASAATSSHGDPRDRDRRQDDEAHGHPALDGDDLRPSVGDGEADVDEGDPHRPDGVDGGRVQPPEQQWRRGLDEADSDAPQLRGAQRSCRAARPGSVAASALIGSSASASRHGGQADEAPRGRCKRAGHARPVDGCSLSSGRKASTPKALALTQAPTASGTATVRGGIGTKLGAAAVRPPSMIEVEVPLRAVARRSGCRACRGPAAG